MGIVTSREARLHSVIPLLVTHGYELDDVFERNDVRVFNEMMKQFCSDSSHIAKHVANMITDLCAAYNAYELFTIFCQHLVDIDIVFSLLCELSTDIAKDDDKDNDCTIIMFTVLYNTNKDHFTKKHRSRLAYYIFTRTTGKIGHIKKMFLLDTEYMAELATHRPIILLCAEYDEDELLYLLNVPMPLKDHICIVRDNLASCSDATKTVLVLNKLCRIYIRRNITRFMYLHYYVLNSLDIDIKTLVYRLVAEVDLFRALC